MARDSKGITQFYRPPTHEPYLPLLPSRRASTPFGWYSLHLPMEGWPGWVDVGGWLYTEIDFLHWELNPGPITHHNTNQARHRVTALIETNALPLSQTATWWLLNWNSTTVACCCHCWWSGCAGILQQVDSHVDNSCQWWSVRSVHCISIQPTCHYTVRFHR